MGKWQEIRITVGEVPVIVERQPEEWELVLPNESPVDGYWRRYSALRRKYLPEPEEDD